MINAKNKIFLLLIFIAGNISAQQKNIGKPFQFHSVNNMGLLEGQAGSTFQLQTINGAQYKSWFAGAGVGLDYYHFRTIPLFIDLRKEFGKRINRLFVYADAGINFYWKRDKDPKQFYYNDAFNNGVYSEAGAGYKVKLSHQIALSFACGYSYKKIAESGSDNYYYFINTPGNTSYLGPPVSSSMSKINYNLKRLVLKAGIEF